MERILAVCEDLEVPLAMEKLKGPSHSLSLLGIQIDTVAGRLQLPAEKLSQLKACWQSGLPGDLVGAASLSQ